MAVRSFPGSEDAPTPSKRQCIRKDESDSSRNLVAVQVFAAVYWPLSMLLLDHWRLISEWLPARDILRLREVNTYFHRLAVTMFQWKYSMPMHIFLPRYGMRMQQKVLANGDRFNGLSVHAIAGYVRAAASMSALNSYEVSEYVFAAARRNMVDLLRWLMRVIPADLTHLNLTLGWAAYTAIDSRCMEAFVFIRGQLLPVGSWHTPFLCRAIRVDFRECVDYLLKVDMFITNAKEEDPFLATFWNERPEYAEKLLANPRVRRELALENILDALCRTNVTADRKKIALLLLPLLDERGYKAEQFPIFMDTFFPKPGNVYVSRIII